MKALEELKGFDFNNLDFNNAGSWPMPVKLIAWVLAFVVVVGLGYYYFLQNRMQSLAKEEATELELREEYSRKAFQAAYIDDYKKQMAEMREIFGTLLKQLPKKTEVPNLLDEITETGFGSGLDFNSIKLEGEVKKEFYIELPISINVRGSYHDIATFVSGVANLQRIVTLHDFDITSDPETNVLTMSITAKTYKYRPRGEEDS